MVTNGLPVPSSAEASALVAAKSAATAAGEVAGPHQVVLEGEVDDAVGRPGGLAQPVEIVQVAAPDLGASGRERLGRAVRARQPHDLMPGLQQLGHDRRADVPGRAGHENTHGKPPGTSDVTWCHHYSTPMTPGDIS